MTRADRSLVVKQQALQVWKSVVPNTSKYLINTPPKQPINTFKQPINTLQVWKSVVPNTPKTLREVLPQLMDKIIAWLASPDMERREVAGGSLGELVRDCIHRVYIYTCITICVFKHLLCTSLYMYIQPYLHT
jgi:hypothetical protein